MTMTKSYAAQAGAPLILPSSLTLIVNLPSTRIDPKPCMCAALTYESDVIRSLQTYLYQASLDRRTRNGKCPLATMHISTRDPALVSRVTQDLRYLSINLETQRPKPTDTVDQIHTCKHALYACTQNIHNLQCILHHTAARRHYRRPSTNNRRPQASMRIDSRRAMECSQLDISDESAHFSHIQD
jgi:hypothetical protein